MSKKVATSIPGIYTITNNQTGTVYVGQAVNIRRRWESHRHYLTNGNHRNCYLQRAWTKYGPEAFEFNVVRNLSGTPNSELSAALNSAEVEVLTPLSDTYNLMEAGLSGGLAGPETRAIWSKQRKAMWASEEFRAKRSEATKALYADPEWKAARDEAVRAGLRTPEAREKSSKRFKKMWQSEEHHKEQSQKRLANWQDPEYRARQSASRSAAWADPEVRARRSAAIKGAHARRRAAKLTVCSSPESASPEALSTEQ